MKFFLNGGGGGVLGKFLLCKGEARNELLEKNVYLLKKKKLRLIFQKWVNKRKECINDIDESKYTILGSDG